VPRYRYQVIWTLARLNSSIPSAVGLVSPAVCAGVVSADVPPVSETTESPCAPHEVFQDTHGVFGYRVPEVVDRPRIIWLSRISTFLGACCDNLPVRARILSFNDRTGRSAMKV